MKYPEVQHGDIYQHYKGPYYKVFYSALHSETLEEVVVYECLYENEKSKYWIRPASLFFGETEVNGQLVPRFKKVENPDL